MSSQDLRARTVRAASWLGGLTVLAVLLLLPSCGQPQTTAEPPRLVEPGQPIAHAVYAQELRAAMRELNRDAYDQLRLQLYTSAGPVLDLRQVEEVADRMAATAQKLPQFVADVQMEPSERQLYNDLSQRLYQQAVVLKQEAQADQLTSAQSTTNRIINTCNTCHTMFRQVAGPLPGGQR